MMNRRLIYRHRHAALLFCACLALTLLALPVRGSAAATEVVINATIDASLVERVSSGSWRVRVSWSLACAGTGPQGGTFQGSLRMIDLTTGERTYFGLVSGPGEETHNVASREQPRPVAFELQISCFDNESLQGSLAKTVASNPVLIPAKDGDPGDGTGGGGGGRGGGGSGGDDATEPLGSGGCRPVLMGTTGDDLLSGGSSGEILFGLGGKDLLKGRGGNDCLLGGTGNDRLFGGGGRDRLTGGRGRDRLYGGAGANAYDAGPGADFVDAANGHRERVNCGSGRDRAHVDRNDVVRRCERVTSP